MAQGRNGVLVVVGTGIQWAGQTTLAARRAIEAADRVLFAVADEGTVRWIRDLRPDAVSFRYDGAGGRPRRRIYEEMVDDVLVELRGGLKVCAIFYGHPGVHCAPAHEAIRRAIAEGFSARMLPGVSFLDCLVADLGFDPGEMGLTVYEATDFLLRRRPFDVYTPLVLTQIAGIGNAGVFDPAAGDRMRHGLAVLAEALCARYRPAHEAVVYDASPHPLDPPRIVRCPLGKLAEAPATGVSTLFVSPLGPAPIDEAVRTQLGRMPGSGTDG
jgi:hypothetical protein